MKFLDWMEQIAKTCPDAAPAPDGVACFHDKSKPAYPCMSCPHGLTRLQCASEGRSASCPDHEQFEKEVMDAGKCTADNCPKVVS